MDLAADDEEPAEPDEPEDDESDEDLESEEDFVGVSEELELDDSPLLELELELVLALFDDSRLSVR